jgi:hypothetical protein
MSDFTASRNALYIYKSDLKNAKENAKKAVENVIFGQGDHARLRH